MAIITLPANLDIGAPFGIEQLRYDMAEQSDATGDMAVRVGPPPRWSISIVAPEAMEISSATAWEALLMQLDGSLNVLAAWDVMRPVPRGTARGAIELAAPAAAGATTLQVSGATAATGTPTLLAGDWLQVGSGLGTSQLVKVVADVALSGGAGAVAVRAPLRRAYTGGTVVTWDKPLCYFRRSPRASGGAWQYINPWVMRGFAYDGIEVFA